MKKAAPMNASTRLNDTELSEQEARQQEVANNGFFMETEVVIREKGYIPFSNDGTGQTIGELIDGQLSSLARNEGEMRDLRISFNDASWQKAKAFYREAYDEFDNRKATRWS